MFSDHTRIKLAISNRKTTRKSPDILKLSITLLNPWIKKMKREIRKIFKLNKSIAYENLQAGGRGTDDRVVRQGRSLLPKTHKIQKYSKYN